MTSLSPGRGQTSLIKGQTSLMFGQTSASVLSKGVRARTISITSGSGYAGSVYTSTSAGQWTADGVAIAGATGTTYTMTVGNEGKAIRCANSNTIEMWVPTDLGASLVTAWDAADSSTITLSGSAVTAWTDKKSAIVASQSVGANQPTYSGTGFGGVRPAIVNATSKWLDLPAAAIPTGSAARAIYAVAGRSAQANEYLMGQAGGNSASLAIGTVNSAGTPIYVDPGAGNLLQGGSWTARSSVGFTYAGGSGGVTKLYQDGTNVASGTATLSTASGTGAIGRWPLFGIAWNGPIAEVLTCNAVPSAADQARIDGYLNWRWGLQANLPAGHAYKSAAPRIQ